MIIDFQRISDFIAEKVAEKVAEKLSIHQEEPQECKGDRIYGIRGLAKFLGCSPCKAQDLKNQGLIPFYSIGKKVYFFENEVTNALKGR